ncbi:MAG TPA: tripartite tricarboxylate transporter substrate binding protein [Xanthobacteraceae bacterium]|nr:tripartite tricarboxylate transporter substrate binding protein [Xanthobacteraceae bacterium]
MRSSNFTSALVLAMGTIAWSHAAAAADYPTRPIKVITNTSAGGLSDIFARAVGQVVQKDWGQPLIVDNRPGGSQNVGARACAEATADGYTICIINADATVYNEYLFKHLPFSPEKDLVPVTQLFHLLQTLVVNSNLKVKTVDELIAASKAKPGTLSYLTASPPLALYMERLKTEKGADWVRVPFRGGGEAVNAIMNGSTPIGLIGIGNVLGHLSAGDMTALVMLNNIHFPQYPNIPTLEETGYKGPASQSWYGLFVPTGTPKPIIDKLAAEFAKIVNEPGFRDKTLIARGLVPAINTPAEFAAEMDKERAIARQVVKDAGLQPQ